jgi:hypothetical protein
VVDVVWHRNGKIALIAVENSARIHSINLDADADILQTTVALDTTANAPEGLFDDEVVVAKLAWNNTSRRLAVSYQPKTLTKKQQQHQQKQPTTPLQKGCELVSLFDTEHQHELMLRFSFIGFIRGPGAKQHSLGGHYSSTGYDSTSSKRRDPNTLVSPSGLDLKMSPVASAAAYTPDGPPDSFFTSHEDIHDSDSSQLLRGNESKLFANESLTMPKFAETPQINSRSKQKLPAAATLLSPIVNTETPIRQIKKALPSTPDATTTTTDATTTASSTAVAAVTTTTTAASTEYVPNVPRFFAFKPSYPRGEGALLSICWTHRQITTIPMAFTDADGTYFNMSGRKGPRRGVKRKPQIPGHVFYRASIANFPDRAAAISNGGGNKRARYGN